MLNTESLPWVESDNDVKDPLQPSEGIVQYMITP